MMPWSSPETRLIYGYTPPVSCGNNASLNSDLMGRGVWSFSLCAGMQRGSGTLGKLCWTGWTSPLVLRCLRTHRAWYTQQSVITELCGLMLFVPMRKGKDGVIFRT